MPKPISSCRLLIECASRTPQGVTMRAIGTMSATATQLMKPVENGGRPGSPQPAQI